MSLSKINKGDTPSQAIKVDTYNAMVSMTEKGLRSEKKMGGGKKTSSTVLIDVRNVSGAVLDEFTIVMLKTSTIDPDVNENEFTRNIVFDIELYDEANSSFGHGGDFAILQTPLKDQKIGKAMLEGISPLKIDVQDAGDEYAEIDQGQAIPKGSGGGPIQILFKPSGTGEKMCYVRFPISTSGGFTIKNNDVVTLPKGCAMQIDGLDATNPKIILVKKCTKGHSDICLPNQGGDLDVTKTATFDKSKGFDFLLSTTGEQEPVIGSPIGTKDDQFELEPGYSGFIVVGWYDMTDPDTMVVTRWVRVVKDTGLQVYEWDSEGTDPNTIKGTPVGGTEIIDNILAYWS